MTQINLNLSVEETNSILQALGNLPFIQVNQLIQKIQSQAGSQLQPQNGNGSENGNGKAKKKEEEKVMA